MAELEAHFENDRSLTWRHMLPAGEFTLGRLPGEGNELWATPWDNFISRKHATLQWQSGRLVVQKLPSAGNPVFYKGVPADEFVVLPNEQFRIGNTVFTVIDEGAPIELSVGPKELRQIRFENADQRVEALAALPEILRQSPDEASLEQQVVEALLRGVPNADRAAVVRVLPESSESDVRVVVTAAAQRGGGAAEFRPSRKLVHDAVRRRLSTLHVWNTSDSRQTPDSKFSLSDPSADWAVCAPLLDDASTGYGLYVSGRLSREVKTSDSVIRDAELRGDLRFAQLTADIFGTLRQVYVLQRRQSLLLRFVSPRVARELLTDTSRSVDAVIEKRPTEATVLFCDLRGSSKFVEGGSTDLDQSWDAVSEALALMTDAIIQFDGVIGDFQGDAAMGFWGWPQAAEDQIEQATRAALAIQKHFVRAARKSGGQTFAFGVGVAHGPAIAGRLGSIDQIKLGVFGPVVNLAARLEGMTKQFRVPILVDENVAAYVASKKHCGWARVRRVAKVRPAGMATAVQISELLPPVGQDSCLPEPKRLDYESALEAFLAGSGKRWEDAEKKLKYLTQDGPSEFLLQYMRGYPKGPPDGWDGVIALEKK
jgi:adenylate cyclase